MHTLLSLWYSGLRDYFAAKVTVTSLCEFSFYNVQLLGVQRAGILLNSLDWTYSSYPGCPGEMRAPGRLCSGMLSAGAVWRGNALLMLAPWWLVERAALTRVV